MKSLLLAALAAATLVLSGCASHDCWRDHHKAPPPAPQPACAKPAPQPAPAAQAAVPAATHSHPKWADCVPNCPRYAGGEVVEIEGDPVHNTVIVRHPVIVDRVDVYTPQPGKCTERWEGCKCPPGTHPKP